MGFGTIARLVSVDGQWETGVFWDTYIEAAIGVRPITAVFAVPTRI